MFEKWIFSVFCSFRSFRSFRITPSVLRSFSSVSDTAIPQGSGRCELLWTRTNRELQRQNDLRRHRALDISCCSADYRIHIPAGERQPRGYPLAHIRLCRCRTFGTIRSLHHCHNTTPRKCRLHACKPERECPKYGFFRRVCSCLLLQREPLERPRLDTRSASFPATRA